MRTILYPIAAPELQQLPQNYAHGLAATLAAVWLAVVVSAAIALVRARRRV